ncbi:hypothetical protein [Campylobacter concisus]|jgi:hypothetical protein|uniref:Uncharacterized protein n=1 Tax=Campylobacter concisus TaxID=199 RepID=A0A1Y5NFE0_9BACT|nr:hypothetical protein [Campylobacter concisus]OUT18194.1 hypothetical protein B9N61_04395 [Campylobacter concisus]
MALDCEKAFEEEMKKIDSIGACLARIEKILTDNLKDKKDDKSGLASLDETNRLLKILCHDLVGKE